MRSHLDHWPADASSGTPGRRTAARPPGRDPAFRDNGPWERLPSTTPVLRRSKRPERRPTSNDESFAFLPTPELFVAPAGQVFDDGPILGRRLRARLCLEAIDFIHEHRVS